MTETPPPLDVLAPDIRRLRGPLESQPHLSVVIPVNAAEDLSRVRWGLGDLAAYRGDRRIEIVLAVNNFPEDSPPALEELRSSGVVAVAEPDAFVPGEIVCFSARMLAVRAASAPAVVSLDADCRVPDATSYLDWCGDQLGRGATAAYTHLSYDDLRPMVSVRVRVLVHHVTRWIKRNVLRIPTIRGGNFAVDRATLIDLHDRQLLGDELSLGPLLAAGGAEIAYSGRRSLRVVTSGRWLLGGWRRLPRYFWYRLRYNLQALRTSPEVVARRRRTLHQENHR